jgi:hypothetical protein
MFRKISAYTILTTLALPLFIAVGSAVVKNKQDIAVIKNEENGRTRQLERIESKLDTIQQYLIQGK